MKELKKIFSALLLIFLILGTTNCVYSAGAGTLHFDGSRKLVGHITIQYTYLKDGSIHTGNILDTDTYSGHRKWDKTIPLEAMYNDIDIIQSVSGTPANCHVRILNYNGNDINVDFSIKSICKKSGSHLKATYLGKTVEAESSNNYYAVWSRYTG